MLCGREGRLLGRDHDADDDVNGGNVVNGDDGAARPRYEVFHPRDLHVDEHSDHPVGASWHSLPPPLRSFRSDLPWPRD